MSPWVTILFFVIALGAGFLIAWLLRRPITTAAGQPTPEEAKIIVEFATKRKFIDEEKTPETGTPREIMDALNRGPAEPE